MLDCVLSADADVCSISEVDAPTFVKGCCGRVQRGNWSVYKGATGVPGGGVAVFLESGWGKRVRWHS